MELGHFVCTSTHEQGENGLTYVVPLSSLFWGGGEGQNVFLVSEQPQMSSRNVHSGFFPSLMIKNV